MAHSLKMPANPAAGTFPDFLRERFGAHWVLAERMTDRLRSTGHERNVTRKQYAAAEREWETLAYGAPVKSLEAAAPALYAALQAISAVSTDGEGNPIPVLLSEAQREQIAHALSLAEGLL